MVKTVLIVGGKRNKSLEIKGREKELKIVHHSLNEKQKPGKKYFESIVRQSDCIILFTDACSHKCMWDVRELSKIHQKPIVYPKGVGTTQALKLAIDVISRIG